jgi:hypothetical protein
MSKPRSFATTCMSTYVNDPTCHYAVPALSQKVSSPEDFNFFLNVATAEGDLQILPRQTKKHGLYLVPNPVQ